MRNAKQRRTEREVSSLEENVVQPSEVEAQEVETEPTLVTMRKHTVRAMQQAKKWKML